MPLNFYNNYNKHLKYLIKIKEIFNNRMQSKIIKQKGVNPSAIPISNILIGRGYWLREFSCTSSFRVRKEFFRIRRFIKQLIRIKGRRAWPNTIKRGNRKSITRIYPIPMPQSHEKCPRVAGPRAGEDSWC